MIESKELTGESDDKGVGMRELGLTKRETNIRQISDYGCSKSGFICAEKGKKFHPIKEAKFNGYRESFCGLSLNKSHGYGSNKSNLFFSETEPKGCMVCITCMNFMIKRKAPGFLEFFILNENNQLPVGAYLQRYLKYLPSEILYDFSLETGERILSCMEYRDKGLALELRDIFALAREYQSGSLSEGEFKSRHRNSYGELTKHLCGRLEFLLHDCSSLEKKKGFWRTKSFAAAQSLHSYKMNEETYIFSSGEFKGCLIDSDEVLSICVSRYLVSRDRSQAVIWADESDEGLFM